MKNSSPRSTPRLPLEIAVRDSLEFVEEPEEPPSSGRSPKSADLPAPRARGSRKSTAARPKPLRTNGAASRSTKVSRVAAEPVAEPTAVIGERAAAFRAKFAPEASDAEWNDWNWQLRSRIRDLAGLERAFELSESEREAVLQLGDRLPVGITPYYASLIDAKRAGVGLRKTMLPVLDELVIERGEAADPLGEDAHMVVDGLVHRYPDRVLFLVSSFCAVYCRYCTRSRLVGKTGEYHFNKSQYEKALAYIADHSEVRDVLISGGDPLTMSNERIDWLLGRLREIPHVEFVRVGSKVPSVLPQRITPELCAILRRHQAWLSVHFMHPDELTPEVSQACGRLADAGIPLGAQVVLNQGVNDDPETMRKLMHGLLKIRVRPYYIYQCDPIPGSRHFRTPVEVGLRIIESLRGHTTGYAVPTFVIDAPGGGGKIPIAPNYFLGRDGDDVVVRNYEGREYRYPDPQDRPVADGEHGLS